MLQEGQLESEEDRKEGLGILAQESKRLQGIVARMLEVARREARGVPYDLVPGDLNEVVREAAERFRRITTDPGLHLEVSLAPESLVIRMDRAAMDDLVTNLITNAWKYRQGAEAHIRVQTERRGRRAEVIVNDDGVGIARRDRRKVFEMFYRADALLTQVPGTGLGLALVRTIVRSHHGSIRVETGDGDRGTCFRIRFPLPKGGGVTHEPASVPVGSPSQTEQEGSTGP
jgi:signal transduction histidine kinase